MKKLMILGAMEMHVPLIQRAKEMGLYVITVDYIPENPGHNLADEAYFDSTTDLDAVLDIAKKCQIDGIMTYNSDPAALSASYVAEKLSLPGNPYNAVKIMSEKNLFRAFLKGNSLNVPNFGNYLSPEDVKIHFDDFSFPVIIKPVDSSGSKGVTVVSKKEEIDSAIDSALSKSRCKKIIIEEYIEPIGHQLHGDGFVENGKLIFIALGDHHFDVFLNNLVPYSTTYPTEHSSEIVEQCKDQVQRFITAVGFKNGGFNVELRISKKDGKPYIIDIGARNGGNFTPKVIEYASGFNFLDRAIKVAMGEPLENIKKTDKIYDFVSYLILHSKNSGVLNNFVLSKKIRDRILEEHIYAKAGDKIEPFIGANAALGVLIMHYENREIMNEIVNNFNDLYKIEMK